MSPFGICCVARGDKSFISALRVCGGALGYFISRGTDGFKYVACMLLIFTAQYVFKDTKLYSKKFFMPAVSAFMFLAIGIAVLIGVGGEAHNVVFMLLESVFIFAFSYLFRFEDKKEISSLLWTGVLVTSFCNISVVFGVIAACIATMMFAYSKGISWGTMAGFIFGGCIDIVAYDTATMLIILAVSGFFGGLLMNWNKTGVSCGFVLSYIAVTMWLGDTVFKVMALFPMLLATILFVFVPPMLMRKFDEVFTKKENGDTETANFAKDKLKRAAQAFKGICEELNIVKNVSNDNDIATAFDRTAERVCRKCRQARMCWQQDTVSTYNALNDAAGFLIKKAHVENEDFPEFFRSRCINLSKFTSVCNEEYAAMQYRLQYQNKMAENREMVCSQYAKLSDILMDVACTMENPIYEPETKQKIDVLLDTVLQDYTSDVYRDSYGRLCVEINCESVVGVEEVLPKIRDILGFEVDEPQIYKEFAKQKMVIKTSEPYEAQVYTAKNSKETISGDTTTCFKTGDGKLYVILSDGMGTGRDARVESIKTVESIKKLIQNGVSPQVALSTVNCTIMLRDECAFSTIDMVELNLIKGEAVFYKLGAAPTYIKRDKKVNRVVKDSLPLGTILYAQKDIETSVMPFYGEESIIMISDGVADINDDEWLVQKLSGDVLASDILSSAKEMGKNDDMSVVVINLSKRGNRVLV